MFTDESSEKPFTLTENDPYLRFTYGQENLPSINFSWEKLTGFDTRKPSTRDDDDTRYQVATQYSIRGLNLAYAYARQVHEDHLKAQTETQDSHVGSIGYAGRFFEDKLTTQSDLFLNYTKTVDEFSRPGTAQVSRTLASGLRAGFDPTPADSMDVPVVQDPALLSGAANDPVTLFTAVGFGLAAPEVVAEIDISLAAAPPFVFPNNLTAFLSFRVFSTDDPTLVTWTEVTGVSETFDPVKNKLAVTFPAVAARFFKAWVSRNDFGPLITATRIEAPTTVAVTSQSQLSRSTWGGTLSAAISYTPFPWLTAAYNMNMNLSEQEPESIRATSGTHNLSLTLRPHRLVTTTGTVQYTFNTSSQAGAQDTSQTIYTLTAGWNPLTTLSSTFTLSRSEQRQGGALETRSDTANVSAAAKVFPALSLDSSYSIGKGENFTQHQELFTQDLSFRLTGQLSPRVSITGNYGLSIRDTTPAPAGTSELTVTHTIGGGAVYTLSRLVNVTTRWDIVDSSDGFSLSNQVKVDWVPTAKTSFFVSYASTRQEFQGVTAHSDTINVNGRWSVSRIVDLSTDFSFSRSVTGSRVQEVESVNVTASLRF